MKIKFSQNIGIIQEVLQTLNAKSPNTKKRHHNFWRKKTVVFYTMYILLITSGVNTSELYIYI